MSALGRHQSRLLQRLLRVCITIVCLVANALVLGADFDNDTVPDGDDNCPLHANLLQKDSDENGIGDACQCADADGNGRIEIADADHIQACAVGARPCPERCDANADKRCNTSDARLVQRAARGKLNDSALTCVERPRLRVLASPSKIDFGGVRIGESAALSVDISSLGAVHPMIVGVDIEGSEEPAETKAVTFELPGSLPILLSPAGLQLRFRFAPVSQGHYLGDIVITLSEGAPLRLAIQGLGLFENSAPVARAGPDRATTAGTQIVLDGSDSFDPDDHPIEFFWSVAQAPAGSTVVLTDEHEPAPMFKADRLGQYTLSLQVTDVKGIESVDTVIVTVHKPEAIWMQLQAAGLANKRLREIVLPGTHDSGTYTINSSSPVAIDCEINQINLLCDLDTPRAFSGWAKAQGLTITGQLEAGTRYLDLRVCWHETSTGPRLYLCHGLLGPTVSSALSQIESFLERTEQEILILDFQTFYETSWLHLALLDEIRARFGDVMLAAGPGFGVEELKNVRAADLWSAGKRVIVLYGEEKLQSECANDEVRSARLEFMEAGRVIRLYDSPNGSIADDWVEIRILRTIEQKVISSFETSFSDADIEVIFHGVNGLDGKVSRLQSTPGAVPGAAPLVTFYEGNGASQDRVCSISFQHGGSITLDFSANDAGPGTVVPQPLAIGNNAELWPRAELLRSQWANSDDIGGLADTIIDELPNFFSGFHVVQGQMTGGLADFLGPFDSSLRDFADRSNPILSDWMRKAWPDDNLNIVMVDYIERSDVVALARQLNDGSLSRTTPSIDLYEGNNVSQDLVCRLDGVPARAIDFTTTSSCINDEARSMVLYDLRAGDVVRLYDNPAGAMEDDWLEIVVKSDLSDRRIASFEASFEDSELEVIYHRNNGLDGKVSRIEFSRSRIGPVIDFYEGNSGTQNLVCSLRAGVNQTIPFPNHSQCDNDEARSAVLYDFPRGRVVKLYDSASGSQNDDWTEIIARRGFKKRTLSSFERSFVDADLEVIYHRNNGLDGKVSRAVINSTRSPPLAVLYEGNNGTQNIVCTIDIGLNRSIDFTRSSLCANDEARSMVLYGVPAGRVIKLYDSPSGSTADDWVQIKVKQAIASYTVNSFQTAVSNAQIEVVPIPNNGLDGKVSRFVVDNTDILAGIPPSYTFKEGNFGLQDTVCTRSASSSYTLNFKNSSACANDEARSVVLNNVPAGARLRVYDDPGCGTGDDWSEIVTFAHVFRFTVNSFESSFNNGVVRQTHFHNNGLDGKVSCIRVTP